MRVDITSVICSVLLATIMMPASGQDLNIEVTPLIGYRFAGEFAATDAEIHNTIELSEEVSFGLITAWSVDRARQGEVLISHYNSTFSESADFSASNTDLAITYAHLGGNVPINNDLLPLKVTGGLGLTYLSPRASQLDDETRFSINIGLASAIELSEHVSFRIDSRLYGTFFNSDSSLFCDAESCAVYISSDVWVQAEVSAGISYRF
jgi:hypothetical protein